MGSRNGSSPMPPLIDFGDDSEVACGLIHGGTMSHTLSSPEHYLGNLLSKSSMTFHSHRTRSSSISSAGSSSNPFVDDERGTEVAQNFVFEEHPAVAPFDGHGRGDVFQIVDSRAGNRGTSTIHRTSQNFDLLSDFSVPLTQSAGVDEASPLRTPQTDLLSGNDISSSDTLFSGSISGSPYSSVQNLDDWFSTPNNPFESPSESPFASSQVGSNSLEDSFANMSVSAGVLPGFSSFQPYHATKPDETCSSQSFQIGSNSPIHRSFVNAREGSRRERVSTVEAQRSLDYEDRSFSHDGNALKLIDVDDEFLSGHLTSPPLSGHDPAIEHVSPEQNSISSKKDPRISQSFLSPSKAEETISPQPSVATLPKVVDFVGAGGGKGVFKAPTRGAVHPERPVPFELRPRPYKEIQTQTTGVLACTNNALWAACDLGIMVWDIEKACGVHCDGRDNVIGDEDAAAFIMLPVHRSITTCLVPDLANNIVWSSHRDGKVRAWPMHLSYSSSDRSNSAILMWQAHQSPVLTMVITSYGELWTGSENGSIRAWPWEVTVKILANAVNSSYAQSTMAMSYIDLKSRGIAAGACTLPNSDVLFLTAEHSTGRVWSGGSHLLALWDARRRDILKVFGPNAQSDFLSPDMSSVHDYIPEDEAKLIMAKVSKKERTQGSLSFFQRSRNAVIGAADAVLRAAVGGQNWDDSKKVGAIASAPDGTVWGGYANGLLVRWDCNGNRLQEQHLIGVGVRSMCVVGARVWVGYADGRLQVLDIETGKPIGAWCAHRSAVVQIEADGDHVFTLAYSGSICGWNLASPSPLDQILLSEMCARQHYYTKHKHLKILSGTWNVSEERASLESLTLWLGNQTAKANIVVIGLQEMEMGAGVLAMAAAKETVGLEGSANGQWWLENIGNAIGGQETFERVASRQLAGLLIGAWVDKKILPYVGEVDVGAVACGFGRALGNKGAVAVKMMVFRRTICFLNCHFAAHMDAVSRRNADFEHVYHKMAFGRSGIGLNTTAVAAGVSSAVQMIRGGNVRRSASGLDFQGGYMENDSPPRPMGADVMGEVLMPELLEADLLIWMGDFNYRIDDVSFEDAIDLISQKSWKALLKRDQLRREMKAGRVFQGMREAPINFPPTYKFNKATNGSCLFPSGYDSSEKKRVPAWCDRILYRDSFDSSGLGEQISLTHPILASVAWYKACMDVMDSDHKPVCCMLNVEVAVTDEVSRRQEYGKLMKFNEQVQQCLQESNIIPEIVLSTDSVSLTDRCPSILRITNRCSYNPAIFNIYCEGEPTGSICPCKQNHNASSEQSPLRGCYGFPRWLQVTPGAGVIGPGQTVEISLQYGSEEVLNDMGSNQHCQRDDTIKELVVVIVVNVKGKVSSFSRQHRICVCYRSFYQPWHRNTMECSHRKSLNQ